MNDILFIILFTLFFIISFAYVWRKDSFYGGYYFFLYVYVIFFMVSYIYYPGFSKDIGGFFGYDIFYEFYFFISFSFGFFLFFLFLFDAIFHGKISGVKVNFALRLDRVSIPYIVFFGLYLCLYSYLLVTDYEKINYDSFSTGAFFTFGVTFKYLSSLLYVTYFLYKISNKKLYGFVFILAFSFWMLGAIKIGSRTDILSFFLGYTFLNIALVRYGVVKRLPYIRYVLIASALVVLMLLIEKYRGSGIEELSLERRILVKDYFAPAHILMASIYHNLIDPMNVFLSNFFNLFFGLNYPYLQTAPGNIMLDGSSSRSTGFAMYVFSEGYMFSGFLGFIYNGFFVALFLVFTRRVFWFKYVYLECFWVGLVSMQIANLVRGQTMYFLKDFYIIYLPMLFLLIVLSGLYKKRGPF
tara:strand:- start:1889 stop:3124 length:1236 start_codon:yes stop_codon:yes gene_type:complete